MDNCPKKDCHEPNALIFKKVVIPASVADDRVNPPKNGDYCNMLVEYVASGNVYIFSSDGIPTMISVDTENIDYAELLNKPTINSVELVGDKSLGDLGITDAINNAVSDEADIRSAADQEIWTEIEAIEAGSDVVDIVGTYAELQQYDTSTLQNNDVIKVLTDETHDNAISYYRWNATTQAFTYVGSEGPYYTASETDTLLATKQDKLIAGSNIQIAADGKTISATDTTYTHFTGATASADGTQGLVPGPLAGDQDKFLKGDGTWQTVSSGATSTTLYQYDRTLYMEPSHTTALTGAQVIDLCKSGEVIVELDDAVLKKAKIIAFDDSNNQAKFIALTVKSFNGEKPALWKLYYSQASQTAANTTGLFMIQPKLTAGSNISISGDTISATDTTYSNFVGTDGTAAGAAGLVPAPAVADDNKYLKSDGTWATVQGGGSTAAVFYGTADTLPGEAGLILYTDDTRTTRATWQQFADALQAGPTTIIFDGDSLDYPYPYVVVASTVYNGTITFTVLDGNEYASYYWNDTDTEPTYSSRGNFQYRLTAGTNISIGTVGGTPNTISVTGMPILYGSQGQNTDGAVTQKLFTDTVGNIESILQTLNSGSGV